MRRRLIVFVLGFLVVLIIYGVVVPGTFLSSVLAGLIGGAVAALIDYYWARRGQE